MQGWPLKHKLHTKQTTQRRTNKTDNMHNYSFLTFCQRGQFLFPLSFSSPCILYKSETFSTSYIVGVCVIYTDFNWDKLILGGEVFSEALVFCMIGLGGQTVNLCHPYKIVKNHTILFLANIWLWFSRLLLLSLFLSTFGIHAIRDANLEAQNTRSTRFAAFESPIVYRNAGRGGGW